MAAIATLKIRKRAQERSIRSDYRCKGALIRFILTVLNAADAVHSVKCCGFFCSCRNWIIRICCSFGRLTTGVRLFSVRSLPTGSKSINGKNLIIRRIKCNVALIFECCCCCYLACSTSLRIESEHNYIARRSLFFFFFFHTKNHSVFCYCYLFLTFSYFFLFMFFSGINLYHSLNLTIRSIPLKTYKHIHHHQHH